MLMTIAADDPEAQPRFAAFRQGLQRLGWTDGRDVRVDTRWSPAMRPTLASRDRWLYRRHAGGEAAHRGCVINFCRSVRSGPIMRQI
jgi:hypothetical protein